MSIITKGKFKNKKVIIRFDWNVPIINGDIQSTKRIDDSLQTLDYILKQKPTRIYIISHLGRPTSRNDYHLSLRPVFKYLKSIYKEQIGFVSFLGDITNVKNTILLLENIRFFKEETQMIETTCAFREQLTSMGDIFVNDAFGCIHRPHSSIIGIDCKEKYIGFLVQKELNCIQTLFSSFTKKDIVMIIGGSKIKDKIDILSNLIPRVNSIIIGGSMANTFLKYTGVNIGQSKIDKEGLSMCKIIFDMSKKYDTKIELPIDFVCNDHFSNQGNIETCDLKNMLSQHMIMDIGIKSIIRCKEIISKHKCVVWNGPLGVFEFEHFSNGTFSIMHFLTRCKFIKTCLGGGDTASCFEKSKLDKSKVDHISTGGSAFLELLKGKELIGVQYCK